MNETKMANMKTWDSPDYRIEENIPNTVKVAMATVKLRVPGVVALQTYTPACCSLTSDIMRLPFPSTRVLKTSMDLWSAPKRILQFKQCTYNLKLCQKTPIQVPNHKKSFNAWKNAKKKLFISNCQMLVLSIKQTFLSVSLEGTQFRDEIHPHLQDLPRRLQEMIGLGFPVAMHSKTTVWWRDTVTFCGPATMVGV
jgi:hypothetical protein